MTITRTEEHVLLAIQALGENAYGVTIHAELDRAGHEIDLAPLYTVLKRMEGKDLIASWVGGATAERGGRAKRYYQLEAAGRECLVEANEMRARFSDPRPVRS